MKYIDQYQGMEVSFWEVFPLFKEVQPFKKLYKEDRSDSKNKSSKTMWYLVLTCDIDSEFYKLDKSEKEEIVFDMAGFNIHDFLAKKSHTLDTLVVDFELFIDTPLSSDVRDLETKMKERSRFITKTPYTLDQMVYPQRENEDGDMENIPGSKPYLVKGTAPQLDKMVTETKKLHEEIRSLRDALNSESASEGKGGKKDSFLEG